MTDDERDKLIRANCRSAANTALELAKLVKQLDAERADRAQMWGALLAIDGAMTRIEGKHAKAPPTPPNGEREHTGRHELIGGVAFEIGDADAKRWANTASVLRWLFAGGMTVYAFVLSLIHFLRGH